MLPRFCFRLVFPIALAVLASVCAHTTPHVADVQVVRPTPVAQQTIFPSQVVYSTNVALFARWTGVEARFAAQ